MSAWALVPVKTRAAAKSRLAAALDARARAALVTAMLAHVLGELRRCPELDGIAVMTPGAERLPDEVLRLKDSAADFNESLCSAFAALAARGCSRVAVVAADLPRLEAAEVSALLVAAEKTRIALAPDRHGTGTNALALALPSRFRPRFGPGSLRRHLAEAAALGVGAATVQLPGLAFDVDEPEDLALLQRGAAPP
ncbi:MAG TPA: 2-phospho-L-lactate guanylyltransferase [Steroidobacteraceae bacterium]|jgi:2-phospho-L-lactate guanylyltransferase|nr:2-phospho-L-lactate guanylyltransferase [Steroidobacteraceae bacterium]